MMIHHVKRVPFDQPPPPYQLTYHITHQPSSLHYHRYYRLVGGSADDNVKSLPRRTTKLTIYSYNHHDDVEPQGEAVIIYYCEDEVRTVIVYYIVDNCHVVLLLIL